MNNKIIYHIDMDTFFVSCERIIKKELNGIPIAIAKNSKRSIATALSNEAKKMGAQVGMPIFEIKKIIPNIVLIEPNLPFYNLISKRIFDYIYNNVSDDVQIYSIDECYVDVSSKFTDFEEAKQFAAKLQKNIFDNFKIPCSIGISYNKFLAKMSTNLAKPHGILVTTYHDIEKHFYDLPINKFFGIGKNNSKKLIDNGIFTIRDFVEFKNFDILKKCLGNNFWNLKQLILGNYVNKKEKIITTIKSIGNSITFEGDDISESEYLLEQLKYLSYKVTERLLLNNNMGSIIKLSLRKTDKKWISFQHNIHKNIFSYEDIYSCICNLFWENWNDIPLRGLGVSISQLKSRNDINVSLFQKNAKPTPKEIVNHINFVFHKPITKMANELEIKHKIKVNNAKMIKENYNLDTKNKIKI